MRTGLGSIYLSSSYSSLKYFNSVRRSLLRSGLAEVEARWVSSVFSGLVAINVEIVMGANSFALGSSMGVNVEKPSGGLINGTTNRANIDMIKLRWGSKSSGHGLNIGEKALVERENVGLELTKSDLYPNFIKDLTAKGMGLRVVDSLTGNHHEDDFTPLETIRRVEILYTESELNTIQAMAKEDAFLVGDFEMVYVLTTPISELMEDDTVEAIRLMQSHGGLILVPQLMFVKIAAGLRHESVEDGSVLYMGD
nr:hypothetical protein [Tanacetum cinerariifolium]GEW29826.1 hypothetical protein [Tanacetum cinerariifolium]